MDYKKLKGLQAADVAVELARELTAAKYNANSKAGDDTWSLSELVNREDREALVAANLLHGLGNRGGRIPAGGGILSPKRTIKLQVLTRQGCSADAEGNALVKNPTEYGFVEPQEKPIEGDQVWVKLRPLEVCPDTMRPMNRVAVRNDRIRRGLPTWEMEVYFVDADGCIEVSLEHAFSMLSQNGHRLAGPEFQRYNSRLKTRDDDGRTVRDAKREVFNWWYKEVPADFKAEKPKRTRKPKAEPKNETNAGADLAFPHEME